MSDQLREDLIVRLHALSTDELRVIRHYVQRLELGRRQYGPLDLSKETRDWRRERLEEIVDAGIYATIEQLVVE